MNLTRISRLVQLISLLQAGKGQNADELSALCGVSRRTMFRDLDLLRQAGVPVLFDDDEGWYRLEQHYFLPPTTFTAEEALAMLLVCYELGADGPDALLRRGAASGDQARSVSCRPVCASRCAASPPPCKSI